MPDETIEAKAMEFYGGVTQVRQLQTTLQQENPELGEVVGGVSSRDAKFDNFPDALVYTQSNITLNLEPSQVQSSVTLPIKEIKTDNTTGGLLLIFTDQEEEIPPEPDPLTTEQLQIGFYGAFLPFATGLYAAQLNEAATAIGQGNISQFITSTGKTQVTVNSSDYNPTDYQYLADILGRSGEAANPTITITSTELENQFNSLVAGHSDQATLQTSWQTQLARVQPEPDPITTEQLQIGFYGAFLPFATGLTSTQLNQAATAIGQGNISRFITSTGKTQVTANSGNYNPTDYQYLADILGRSGEAANPTITITSTELENQFNSLVAGYSDQATLQTNWQTQLARIPTVDPVSMSTFNQRLTSLQYLSYVFSRPLNIVDKYSVQQSVLSGDIAPFIAKVQASAAFSNAGTANFTGSNYTVLLQLLPKPYSASTSITKQEFQSLFDRIMAIDSGQNRQTHLNQMWANISR